MSDDTPYAARLDALRTALAERELAAELISNPVNLRYLTGFTGSSGWLFCGLDRMILVTDGRYEQQVGEEVPGGLGMELVVVREKILDEVARQAGSAFGGRRIGFEGAHLSVEQHSKLAADAVSVRWTSTPGLVEALRARKEPGEVAALEEAGRITAEALGRVLPLVTAGMREVDVACELDYRMRLLGAEGPAFETIVASGPRTALPHAQTSHRVLQEGDLLLIDFGACRAGYRADITRMFVIGEPEDRQRAVYEAVEAAHEEARSALRGGVEGREVDAAARRPLTVRDMVERFAHGTGHGVGLEVHEAPRLSRTSEDRLEAGMVVTVEPGLYFPGWGGIRIEDDYLVTDGDARRLVEIAEGLRALPL